MHVLLAPQSRLTRKPVFETKPTSLFDPDELFWGPCLTLIRESNQSFLLEPSAGCSQRTLKTLAGHMLCYSPFDPLSRVQTFVVKHFSRLRNIIPRCVFERRCRVSQVPLFDDAEMCEYTQESQCRDAILHVPTPLRKNLHIVQM